ncbi:MAG: hypothetical protein ACRERC_01280 [Candidatus Binatia bacterium]
MERVADTLKRFDEADELVNDRLPGMPMLGFFTGAVVSMGIWAALAVLALV